MALVICCVFLTLRMRRRMSIKLGILLRSAYGRGNPDHFGGLILLI